MQYEQEKQQLIQGFNTWDTRSLSCHVRMPQGYAINIGFKEFLRGQYLKEPLIGVFNDESAVVQAGPHAYDGSYTSLDISWRRLRFRIETAHGQSSAELVMKVSLLENTTRFVPLCVAEGAVLWNFPGYSMRKENSLYWNNPKGETMEFHLVSGKLHEEVTLPCQAGYLPVELSESAYFSTNLKDTQDTVEQQLANAKQRWEAQKQQYGELADAWEAMQTCLAWNEIYEPQKKRITSNVSRVWNLQRGGYGMFCWDNFFAAMMLSLDDPARGRANALEILNEKTPEGFVPNGSMGNGRKTFDRSQPPVGSIAVREIYRRDPQLWFLEKTFPQLLTWNRWWVSARLNGELLSWGSNRYDNKWEMDGIFCNNGGALESGMDNSPLYDEDEIRFDTQKSVHKLWDVGLNSLYIHDCEVLAELAGILGKTAEQQELTQRAEKLKQNIKQLWDEKNGFYYNYKTDEHCFSRRISPCNFYPLLTGTPSPQQFERMMNEHFFNPDEFYGEWILPAIARNDPAYHDNNYWRGRIWAPLNFLVYLGMLQYPDCEARKYLVERSLALLLNEWRKHRHVHENYNADTGEGDDVQNSDPFYQWSGLLALIGLVDRGYLPGFGNTLL